VIDSRKRQLEVTDILMIFANEAQQFEDEELTPQQIYAAILAEMNIKGNQTVRFGNTLFMIDPSEEEKGSAMFRALNADIPENYLEHCKQFIKVAQDSGYSLLITQFKDPRIARLLQAVQKTGQDFYTPDTAMELNQGEDGMYQAVIYQQSKHETEES